MNRVASLLGTFVYMPARCNHISGRSHSGSFASEYAAALVVFFLFITFPAIDLATVAYRYNMLVTAARECAHAGAVADTFSSGSSSSSAVDAVNAVFSRWRQSASYAIANPIVKTRINTTDINSKVVTYGGWNTKLATAPPAGSICTLECLVSGDVRPLAVMQGSPIQVAGVTSPIHFDVASQELVETPSGTNQ